MANCCLCSAEFRKRIKFKGYEKRLLSNLLPHKDVTFYEVLQMVCNYKADFDAVCSVFSEVIALSDTLHSSHIRR